MSVDARPDWARSLVFFHLLKTVCHFKSQRNNCTLMIANAITCVISVTLFLKAEHCWKWDASVC